jgi:hypothetical protein
MTMTIVNTKDEITTTKSFAYTSTINNILEFLHECYGDEIVQKKRAGESHVYTCNNPDILGAVLKLATDITSYASTNTPFTGKYEVMDSTWLIEGSVENCQKTLM